MNSNIALVSCLLIAGTKVMGADIRDVYVNDLKMQKVKLKLGSATVLRFSSKPKKVVVGNQNYYSIEFIENDLTIQPLGEVPTNLFVYTPYHTYGFDLTVCEKCRGDDLLRVKWKSKHQRRNSPKKSLIPGYYPIGKSTVLSKKIKIEVIKTKIDESGSLRIFDIAVSNLSKEGLPIKDFKIDAIQGKHPLKKQGFVIEKDNLKPKELSKARLFIPANYKSTISIRFSRGAKKSHIKIWRKYLR